jgi:hypothetical protein
MIPVSPVIKGFEKFEILLGKGQPEYRPVPTVVSENIDRKGEKRFISRWEFTPFERELIANGGTLLFQQLVFGVDLFNPVCLSVEPKIGVDPDEQIILQGSDEIQLMVKGVS